MLKTQALPADPPEMTAALAWLHETPGADPLAALVPLRRHLRGVLSLQLQPLVLLRILDLFEPRIAKVHAAITPLLIEAAIPLPRNLRVVSQGLFDLHGELVSGFLRIADHAVGESFQRPKRRRDALIARALNSLRNQYELSQQLCSAAPTDFWRNIGHLFLADGGLPISSADSAARPLLQYLLALNAAQTEALTNREQRFLCEYVSKLASKVEITSRLPANTKAWLWMDTHDARAPTPVVRRPSPPSGEGLMFYSCHQLGKIAQLHLDALAQGTHPAQLGLDEAAGSTDYRNVLHHAARRWLNPPQRRHTRKRGNYRVQVCPTLKTLWSLQRGEITKTEINTTTEWMILNDSPAGYAAMHVSGEMPSLLPGSVIGIRRESHEPWSLCLIRWVRSDNAEHLEVGLEMLAARAEAVRIACSSRPKEPLPAFLLPALDALQRGETLLTERGLYDNGRIALLFESPGRLQVVECQPLPLVLQTSSIELFEFERVQLPGV